MSVTTITVTGPVKTAAGANATGTVEFRLTQPLMSAGELVAGQTPVVATISAGNLSQALYATNDPTTSNIGLTYEIWLKLTGARPRKYEVELDYLTSGGTVKLSDLVEVEPGPAIASYATASAMTVETAARIAGDLANDTTSIINALIYGG